MNTELSMSLDKNLGNLYDAILSAEDAAQDTDTRTLGYTNALNAHFPYEREMGIEVETDAIYLAFELSMIAYPLYWQGVDGAAIADLQMQFVRDTLGSSAITAQMLRLF